MYFVLRDLQCAASPGVHGPIYDLFDREGLIHTVINRY